MAAEGRFGWFRRFLWRMPFRRAGLIAMAALAASGAGIVVMGVPGLSGATGASAAGGIVDAFMAPLAVLAGRSPGARGAGALLQTKPAAEAPPTDRYRSRRVPGEPFVEVPPFFDLPITPPLLDADFPLPSAPYGDGFGPAYPGGFFDDGGGWFGDGGGGFGSPPFYVPPPEGPTPAPSIPEPHAWTMLIFGLGIVGSLLRRRERRPFKA
jgi:hypothetical protein